jgi:hypothetical protein
MVLRNATAGGPTGTAVQREVSQSKRHAFARLHFRFDVAAERAPSATYPFAGITFALGAVFLGLEIAVCRHDADVAPSAARSRPPFLRW